MIKINTYTIKLNEYQIKKITNITESSEARNIVEKYANIVKNKAIQKMPFAPIHKGKGERLKNSIITTPSKLKKINVNIKGNKYKTNSWQVQVKPKKRQNYYFVVMSGKNTYHTKNGDVKKELNYSVSTAESFPVEKAYNSIKKDMSASFTNLIYKKSKEMNGE